MKKLLPCAAAALLLAAGCASSVGSDGRLAHKQFDVRGSGLDWMEFVYTPAPDSPAFAHPCRLELYGSGLARLRTGPSPQVRDDFASDPSDPHWNDLVVESLAMTPDEMRGVMQVFVDEGVVAAVPRRASSGRLPSGACGGTVNTEKFRLSTDNAALVGTVEDFLETNFGPALRAAARLPKAAPGSRGR